MKRFTETTKWDDPWFLDLSQGAKLLWVYLLDKCDNAGVVDIHTRKAAFELSTDITDIQESLDELSSRLASMDNGKYHIKGFVNFQFGVLKDTSNLHKNVIQLLKNHGLPNPSDTLDEGFTKGPSKGKGILKAKVKAKVNYTEQFEAIWKIYGMKGSKQTSFELWTKLSEKEKDDLVKSIKPYHNEVTEKQFRKNFEGFIRKRMFNDVLERQAAGVSQNTEPLHSGGWGQIQPQVVVADDESIDDIQF